MKLHTIEETVVLPIAIDEAWQFFSNPANLGLLTPPELGWEILRRPGPNVYAGAIIAYRIRPILGLPLTWVSEITQVAAPYYFVDEQRGGPYQVWHHEHHLRERPGGTEVRDLVNYALPLDPLSRPIHDRLVQPQLRRIFRYRRRALARLFAPAHGRGEGQSAAHAL